MAYKIMRKVYVRFQPRWMTRFLFNLSPSIYEEVDSLDAARQHLHDVKQYMMDSRLTENNSRLQFIEEDDSITILSSKKRVFLKFYIHTLTSPLA